MIQDEMLDCLVMEPGAAGLAAAVYLGRYRRKVLVLDDGASRLSMIPKTRNVIGFPDGIAGPELLERMRLHASRYGVSPEMGRVERLSPMPDGAFEAVAGSRRLRARKVLLGHGARDVEPDLPGLAPPSRPARCAIARFATATKRKASASPCSARRSTACVSPPSSRALAIRSLGSRWVHSMLCPTAISSGCASWVCSSPTASLAIFAAIQAKASWSRCTTGRR